MQTGRPENGSVGITVRNGSLGSAVNEAGVSVTFVQGQVLENI